ncbi:hypothetical protein F9879_19980 [Morganella morganii]|nr:hypothetical protein [Morganella morganii]
MVNGEAGVQWTDCPVGGVCLCGRLVPLTDYEDNSLIEYATVFPEAGSANSAVRLETERLEELTNAQWLDVTTQLV